MAITDPTAPQPNSAMPAQTQPLLQPAVAQTTTAERGPSLSEPRWSDWSIDGHIDEDLGEYLEKNLSPPFQAILEEFLISADTCVQRFDSLRQRHERWRRGIIVGTGLVAIINALSALVAGLPHRDDTLPLLAVVVAGLAAVAAAVLAILANLENFGNFLERAQAYREARELYLDAYREFDRLWRVYVIAFWSRPEALVNASELYRRICLRDNELRRKVKDLTQPRTAQGAS